jgi:hypothetical protein
MFSYYDLFYETSSAVRGVLLEKFPCQLSSRRPPNVVQIIKQKCQHKCLEKPGSNNIIIVKDEVSN